MRGTRILRYVGSREVPEAEVYDPVERWAHRCEPISSQTFLGLDHVALRKIQNSIANPLFSDFEKREGAALFTPICPESESALRWMQTQTPILYNMRPVEKVDPKPEVDFEVNLMEPLIGWKSWHADSGILKSNGGTFFWRPGKAAEALCGAGCTKVPAEHHTCGIYGAESQLTAEGYGGVLGQVYGWGRYIRHTGGWKAQYAYPRCFYLREEQMNLIEFLKAYHVPVYVEQPVKMYDPAEEGYDEYWQTEAHRDFRTAEDSGASEARDDEED